MRAQVRDRSYKKGRNANCFSGSNSVVDFLVLVINNYTIDAKNTKLT